MGHWNLVSATPSIRDRNDVYGHYFAITFRLKYIPSMMSSFAEMPVLEWKETITMIEKVKKTWWSAEFDQFGRLPNSPTFGSWVYRYILAHTAVLEGDYSDRKPSRLYDKNGNKLPQNTFSRAATNKISADAVRDYLKKNGGILDVTVTDSPGINKPVDDTSDKFRILTFDCGLRGISLRIKAIQHLRVAGINMGHWSRSCTIGSVSEPFQTTGMQKIAAPADVTIVRPFTGGPSQGTYM